MTHDELCPIEWLHGSGPSGLTKVPCQCDLIARARATQREEDARIVESLMPSDPDHSGEMYLYLEGEWVEQSLAAAAIRAGA